jgi:hypothetical protein
MTPETKLNIALAIACWIAVLVVYLDLFVWRVAA